MSQSGVAHIATPPPWERTEWEDEAACRNIHQFTEQPIRKQLSVCRGSNGSPACPVRVECLELGLQQPLHISGHVDFVFGGLKPSELFRLHKKRRQHERVSAA